VSRSLAATDIGKELIKNALHAKKWTAEDLRENFNANEKVSVGRATAYGFCAGKTIRPEYFKPFCNILYLDWEIVTGLKSISPPQDKPVEHNSIKSEDTTDESAIIKMQEENLLDRVRSHCREKILHNYGEIRLLSGEKIGVDQLYVDVWLLTREPRTFLVSQDKMLESFDLRKDRLGLGDLIERRSGFDIANSQAKLVILGKPGAGKTTFLKHLAIDWCNGKFLPDLIAVFIEFRQIYDDQWDFINEICKELDIEKKQQVEGLLRDGKLLIMMDGFDEVATGELRQKIQQKLGSIVKDYPKNRFIMTCRTQILKSIPGGFTSVEVADFRNIQVKKFLMNWFRANRQNEMVVAERWTKFAIAISRNFALKELTVTPVLLSLICLVFQDEGEIPTQAGLLYEKGVQLLLGKWNDSKDINVGDRHRDLQEIRCRAERKFIDPDCGKQIRES
jgi:adenylate kinase family enzyme